MEQVYCKEGHEHHTVSKKDRLIMLLLVVVLAVLFLRPFVALQNINRGDSFLNYGFYNRAILQYKRATLLDSNNEKIYSWLGYAYNKKGDFDNAIESYEKAVELNPANNEVNLELGIVYYHKYQKTGKRVFYEKAVETFEKIIERDPSNESVKFMLERLKNN
ncbi:tetratricopeptide repeat protein [Candidatus Oleimmundimicrobium sp.]|uniref:tetratricopeptide repeat protein n=1 Tax=Candidatus Oleimmundimicrobium sp. TaxID=3060597 RepID=UPI00271BEAF4|nr:tetratricopeptide repeat protein [Candidatus Oleimmundimicrobium sp.]MDO8886604.1 tetratricopeptide repeat protein [Candidatus Oleimmundimicrobium sp.]